MKIHIVQKDETLWKIAQKYGVSLENVIAANPQISNPEMIMPGMKIKIPTASDSKQQPAPGNKKQQVAPTPSPTAKKEKKEVKPPNQILPSIEEDEDKKWEPLKKEMPALPIHFNKQQPAPPQPAPTQTSQDLKWTQLTNNFETNIHPMQMMEDENDVAGVQEQMKPQYQPMPQPQQMPMPSHHQMPMQAPCYSKDGIPYGFGNSGPGPMGQMQPYPFPDGSQPQVMGAQQQPMHGWNQGQMPTMNQPQGQYGQQMPWGPSQMPQNQGMPNMAQQPMQQMMPQQMQNQQNMQQQPQQMPGEPMIPQPGMPNYPLMPMPYGMQAPQQMPYQPYGPGQSMNDDCGCGGNREE
ncbi:SafA/ExsA family spore coat assembly protein [Gracilibacillus kekensis]|uniref:Morphogenetic protein associated with SpoVID n=1 Tax=Gracilibacillus kekensis TaxID=1027249 RepID=A0A1M7NYJ2_9BACI|nr:SafA/ExsA family spore coat assembly protein [Gracilibacillus kekensis]SHN09126.1 morphogenetic protein associated with SpoVID [Gracilibacillus kekensis]